MFRSISGGFCQPARKAKRTDIRLFNSLDASVRSIWKIGTVSLSKPHHFRCSSQDGESPVNCQTWTLSFFKVWSWSYQMPPNSYLINKMWMNNQHFRDHYHDTEIGKKETMKHNEISIYRSVSLTTISWYTAWGTWKLTFVAMVEETKFKLSEHERFLFRIT